MKNVRITGSGKIIVEIFHSVQFTGIDVEGISDDKLEQKGRDALQERFFEKIMPVLDQLTNVVGEWEVTDHDEDIDIEEVGEDE